MDRLVRHGCIDVLVNSARIMPLPVVEEFRVEEWSAMMDVNLRGVLHRIAALLPSMRECCRGHTMNLASTAANWVDATGVLWSATKDAVRAVSEGLR